MNFPVSFDDTRWAGFAAWAPFLARRRIEKFMRIKILDARTALGRRRVTFQGDDEAAGEMLCGLETA